MKGYLFPRVMLVAAVITIASTSVRGDVTIKRHSTMDGMGGLLKSSTTSNESYDGDMMVNDSETKMENKLLKMFGGGKPVLMTQIMRLDKELIWDVRHKDKKYTELTFAEMRAMMDSLGSIMSAGADPMAQQKPTFDTSDITFSEPKFEIKRTGRKETISGYECDQAIMTMVTEGANRKTGEKMILDLTLDMMLARNVAGADEITAFGVRMARAMGFELDQGAAKSMTKMLVMYSIDPEKLADEARKLEGFAMKSAMSFSIGGDAMDSARADAQKAKQQEAKDKEDQVKKDEQTPSDASGMAAKALGGLFGKKQKNNDKEKSKGETASEAPPGAIFSMTTTVTGIETGSVPPTIFEVPSGYKLEKTDLQKN